MLPTVRRGVCAAALLLSLSLTLAQADNSVTQAVTGGAQSATVRDLTLEPVPYSTSDQHSQGTLQLTVSDGSGTGAGWQVTLQSSAFVYSGSHAGQNIPAAAFAITSAAPSVTTSGQAFDATGGPYVPSSGATGALDMARTVLRADAGFGQGDYTQDLAVELTIPGMSVVGVYTGSFTVTIGAAP
jgi:hypothetical protein